MAKQMKLMLSTAQSGRHYIKDLLSLPIGALVTFPKQVATGSGLRVLFGWGVGRANWNPDSLS